MGMIKYNIEERDGFLIMGDLPHDCIFNKVRTGCGGTSIALRNTENYVIAVPTTELIINKCYPTSNGQIWNSEDFKAGKSPVENLFGLYGNLNGKLKAELTNYLSTLNPKKIMCTYDKLPKILEIIDGKEYRLLVDEYHNFLKQYSFRENAINGILDNFRKFKSFCFLSATPIESNLKPGALSGVTEYIANWEDIQKIKIVPKKTNKPYMLIAGIIQAYQRQGFITVGGDKRSNEAYIFMNSVADIVKVLGQTHLTNENCRVICADTEKNLKKLNGFAISNSASKSKQFNFITCKSFEGADFYSETGLCFVVSNVQNANTLVSIDIDLPQIAGRLRNKDNPFKNLVVHIFNTRKDDLFADYADMEKEAKRQLQYAQERADSFNKLSDGAKKQQRKEVEKNSIYLKYAKDQDCFVVDDLLFKVNLYEYKLIHEIYSSGKCLLGEYEKAGLDNAPIDWILLDDKFLNALGKKPTFLEAFERYTSLTYTLDLQEKREIEERFSFIRKAYSDLGEDEVKRLRTAGAVKQALLKREIEKEPNCSEMFALLSKHITVGRFYSKSDLDSICETFNFKSIKRLKTWYDIEGKTQRVDGNPTYGYLVKSVLPLFSNV